jgi:hypothetical protein
VLVGAGLLVAQVPWLMGAGLKRDLIFDFTKWGVTWRLIGITMPRRTAAITLIAGGSPTAGQESKKARAGTARPGQ